MIDIEFDCVISIRIRKYYTGKETSVQTFYDFVGDIFMKIHDINKCAHFLMQNILETLFL